MGYYNVGFLWWFGVYCEFGGLVRVVASVSGAF